MPANAPNEATNDPRHGNSRPVPDPTLLTTQQLLREMGNLKEVIFTRLDGMDRAILLFQENLTRVPTDTDKQIARLQELQEEKTRAAATSVELIRDVLQTRLDGMDKAIRLLQDTADRLPIRIDEKIASLSDVHEEKFRSIAVQFVERDVRTEQTSRDSKVAVDAALQAAKEAVAEQNRSSALAISKSEAGTVKQIDQQGLLIQTATSALDGKITDVKERLTRIEGVDQGALRVTTATVQEKQSSVGVMVAIGVGLLAAAVGIAAIIVSIVKH